MASTLACVALGLAVALLWMQTWDPLAAATLRRLLRAPATNAQSDLTALLRRDPPIGSTLPEGCAASSALRTAAARKALQPILLVYAGECSSCVRVDLQAWRRQALSSRAQMVLFTSADRKVATSFARDLGLTDTPIVSDLDGSLIRALNARFAPRGYLYDVERRLVWIQKQLPEHLPTLSDDRTFGEALNRLRGARL